MLGLERIGIDDQHANGLAAQRGHVAAMRDDANLAFLDFLQAERRRRPADIDLAGHHRGQRCGRAAGRSWLGLGAELLTKATTMLFELDPLVE